MRAHDVGVGGSTPGSTPGFFLQDIDFILLTGDFPAHDMWYQSREYNLGTSEAVVDIVKEVFAGVPVYPSIGNHEAFPGNM